MMTLKVKYHKNGEDWYADVWVPDPFTANKTYLVEESMKRRFDVDDFEIIRSYPEGEYCSLIQFN